MRPSDANASDVRRSSPRSRPLKVVAAALDPDVGPPEHTPDVGYPVMLKLSRVLDPDEARMVCERNPFLRATSGSRKLVALDTSVETLRPHRDRIQLLLAEGESDALAEAAGPGEGARRAAG